MDMKEQDAAHSFDADFYIGKEQFQALKNAKVIRLTDGRAFVEKELAVGIMRTYTEEMQAELTRLRSELQQKNEFISASEQFNATQGQSYRNTIEKLKSELQQAKQEIANHAWTKIDGTNYPLNKLLIVWNGTYNFAHFNTAYNKWMGLGTETSDTRNLMQFPPTHFMDIPEQPKQS